MEPDADEAGLTRPDAAAAGRSPLTPPVTLDAGRRERGRTARHTTATTGASEAEAA